jgi:hypothetical protein
MKFRRIFQAIISNLRSRTGESTTGSTRTHRKAGQATLSEFFSDAGMRRSADADIAGWHVMTQEAAGSKNLPRGVL